VKVNYSSLTLITPSSFLLVDAIAPMVLYHSKKKKEKTQTSPSLKESRQSPSLKETKWLGMFRLYTQLCFDRPSWPSIYRSTTQVVIEVVKQSGRALQYASTELKGDKEVGHHHFPSTPPSPFFCRRPLKHSFPR
jgi:hypothetical protein